MDWGLVVRQCVWPCLVGYMLTSWCLVSFVSRDASSDSCSSSNADLSLLGFILLFFSSSNETTPDAIWEQLEGSESERSESPFFLSSSSCLGWIQPPYVSPLYLHPIGLQLTTVPLSILPISRCPS